MYMLDIYNPSTGSVVVKTCMMVLHRLSAGLQNRHDNPLWQWKRAVVKTGLLNKSKMHDIPLPTFNQFCDTQYRLQETTTGIQHAWQYSKLNCQTSTGFQLALRQSKRHCWTSISIQLALQLSKYTQRTLKSLQNVYDDLPQAFNTLHVWPALQAHNRGMTIPCRLSTIQPVIQTNRGISTCMGFNKFWVLKTGLPNNYRPLISFGRH